MPFTRSYSLGDIGQAPRGSRLGFDHFGRVAVIHDAIYTVLNDSTWLNIAGADGKRRIPMANVVQAADGRSYYGGRGSWGYVELRPDGRLHPVSLVPPHPPSWIAAAAFNDIITTSEGVYFESLNGVAYWDFIQKRTLFFEVSRLSRAFRVGERVYLSAFAKPLYYINTKTGTLQPAAPTEVDANVVEFSTPLDERRSLLALVDGRMVTFDGQKTSPWPNGIGSGITGHVSAVQRLVDGWIAIGVTGQGLLLYSENGNLLMALTTSPYHNITALANREPGVLWVETEDSVDKILYRSPLSAFSQRLGLPISWPIVVSRSGELFIASEGKLYRAVPADHAEPTRFELCEKQPPGGAWALAARGKHMLVGNGGGLFSVESDGSLRPIPAVGDLAQLVMTDENHCYVIGRAEIAWLEWRNNGWIEATPRIAGVRNPAIVHRVGNSVWMELGGDGVGRLWLRNGRLQLDIVPNESWANGSWVNIGFVDDIVVLSSLPDEHRRFFNEKTGTWCEDPELQRLLERSPYWIARLVKDENGVIWATHDEGLIRFAPNGHGYDMDANSFDLVNDRYPIIRLLPNNDIWVYTERSLYHLEQPLYPAPPHPPKPVLVSLVDQQRGEEMISRAYAPSLQLPYSKNSITFRFYSGTDSWERIPQYEYRLGENEPWTSLDGSLLGFRALPEGRYRLEIRIAAPLSNAGASSNFDFEILPPWHRTAPAYLLFGLAILFLLVGILRWSTYLERRRNRKLAKLVAARTRELEATMAKLSDETKKAATLEERDRLANEIHDSVQQGLTGAILQLDTTLKSPAVNGDLRSRLDVVRNMVSYARQEVQHAVWDMESPLLEGTGLEDALRNLTTFVESGDVRIDVAVSGTAAPLDRMVSHNLLRISQEATTNAFRHAKARRIEIRLEYSDSSVTLTISDDGIGFHPSDVFQAKIGHLGLRGIRSRVKKLRGELTIDSEPGRGTLLRIVVPLGIHEDHFYNAETERA